MFSLRFLIQHKSNYLLYCLYIHSYLRKSMETVKTKSFAPQVSTGTHQKLEKFVHSGNNYLHTGICVNICSCHIIFIHI